MKSTAALKWNENDASERITAYYEEEVLMKTKRERKTTCAANCEPKVESGFSLDATIKTHNSQLL